MVKVGFKFMVDKETCFADWVKFFVHRENAWQATKRETDYYINLAGELNKPERQALMKLQHILDKDSEELFWGCRYVGAEITDVEQRKEWELIRATLNAKFEKTWEQESPLLFRWKEILEEYPLEEINPILEAAALFWGLEDFKKGITVRLVFYWSSNFVKGYSFRNIENFIFLGISHAFVSMRMKAMSTLTHELVHIFENKSSISKNVFQDFARAMSDGGVDKPKPGSKPRWRNLFNECIVKSIASGGLWDDYSYRTVFSKKGELIPPLMEIDFKKEAGNYNVQTRWVAIQILDTTANYLDNKKRIDKTYAEAVASAWLELRECIESTSV